MVIEMGMVTGTLQFLISCGTFLGMMYTLYKFASKPNVTQDQRISDLEAWIKEAEKRLHIGDEHFDRIDDANMVTQSALLAIMDTLINGDNKDELKKQRDNLYRHLTEKGNDLRNR